MSSAKAAVEAAVYDALAQTISGATVYQDAPDNAPLPIVVIGDMRSARLPGKASSPDRSVTVSIVTLIEAQERAPLLALMDQIETALDGGTFVADPWTLSGTFDDDEAVLAEDGSTYSGLSTFTFLALAD
ncbi:DUF3168 domain-containing protein [Microvirga sp. SRT01]|uniref:DUF3168 domain-containing protein n=1 Tax=Sphingomonas longa TaxID=2778730 RepID=A0ABS2D897_9SPHN|nr:MULTISPECIES: DUF3168 domain-containing protein [Alphaproteobacteria]MBM6576346.1 DUF3168 domain-containing protein [Sphingomonas sp. BT552]MBR7709392.1 DUF3168 domain-containing protein [Microvirga sp. SRT01]